MFIQLNVKTGLYITIQFSVSRVSMSKAVSFKTIQFSISTLFRCNYSLIVKNILYQAIQFSQIFLIQTIQYSISMQLVLFNPSIGPLSDATTQSGPRIDGNEGVLRIHQRFSITETSPSDCFASYLGHSFFFFFLLHWFFFLKHWLLLSREAVSVFDWAIYIYIFISYVAIYIHKLCCKSIEKVHIILFQLCFCDFENEIYKSC